MRQEVQGDAGYGRFFCQVSFKLKDVLGLLLIASALNLDPRGLYAEVAVIAYHFHWSKSECMQMSRKERQRWLEEITRINKAIAKSMKRGKR